MTHPLHRRLSVLERAPGAGHTAWRAYGTEAEAAACAEPQAPVTTLVVIITGVQRPPSVA